MSDRPYQIAVPRHLVDCQLFGSVDVFLAIDFCLGPRVRVLRSRFMVWHVPDESSAQSLLDVAMSSPGPAQFAKRVWPFRHHRADMLDKKLFGTTAVVAFFEPTRLINRVHPKIMRAARAKRAVLYHKQRTAQDGAPDWSVLLHPLPGHLQSASAPIFPYLDLTSLG